MSVKVLEFLKDKGLEDRYVVHNELIDTVEHAAREIGIREEEVAKTLSFIVDDRVIVIVMAGDMRVNSSKFKSYFHMKPKMVPRSDVEELIGHEPGGVCPFAVNNNVEVWLDESIKKYEYVYPAGGDVYSSVKIKPIELENIIDNINWCDVCK